MKDWDPFQVLNHLSIKSEYFLQIALDKNGKVLSSDSGLGPIPSLFDKQHKPLQFSDCFLASDWVKFDTQRMKAWKTKHNSFLVELHKLNHPSEETIRTKWEFFFVAEDYGTCVGIGHPIDPIRPYNIGLGEFIDGSTFSNEVIDSLLENKMLGFWEFDLNERHENISNHLAHTLGYTEEEIRILGRIPWKKHIHPEDLEAFTNLLYTHFRTPGNVPFKTEFRLISKGKQTTWVMAFGQTVEWDQMGAPRRVQGIFLDINEKKRQEFWLKEHHFFLNELAFQQSHSLRARVANILGVLEILELEELSPSSQKLVNILKKETKMLDESLKKSIKESVQHHKILEQGLGTSDQ